MRTFGFADWFTARSSRGILPSAMALPGGSWLNPSRDDPAGRTQRMSQDRSSVEGVVQAYFDGLYEGSADKLGAIFHPSADLRWVEKGELQVLTVPDWLDPRGKG